MQEVQGLIWGLNAIIRAGFVETVVQGLLSSGDTIYKGLV